MDKQIGIVLMNLFSWVAIEGETEINLTDIHRSLALTVCAWLVFGSRLFPSFDEDERQLERELLNLRNRSEGSKKNYK